MKHLPTRMKFDLNTRTTNSRIHNNSRKRIKTIKRIKSVILSSLIFTCSCSTATAMESGSQSKKNLWLEAGQGYAGVDIETLDGGAEFGVFFHLGGTLRKDKHLFNVYHNGFSTDDRHGISETGIKYGRYWENRWVFVSAMTGVSVVKAGFEEDDYSGIGIPAEAGAFLKLGFMNIGLNYAVNVSDDHYLDAVSLVAKVNF